MSGVERFAPTVGRGDGAWAGQTVFVPDMCQSSTGAYVRHSDYATLEVRNTELVDQVAEEEAITEKVCKLLAETILMLRGPAPELTLWSYHDIAYWARQIVAERDALLRRVDELETRLAEADGALVAAQKDAVRYQLIRGGKVSLSKFFEYTEIGQGGSEYAYLESMHTDERLDAAIDEAIEQEGRQG